MKCWIYAVMLVAAGAMMGCSSGGSGSANGGNGGDGGSDGGNGGAGGNPTTTVTTGGMTTTTTSQKNCADEATFADCASCFATDYPMGAELYDALVGCLACTACYTACNGAMVGCPMPPAMPDACDVDGEVCGADMNPATGCTKCALMGTCADEYSACGMSQECQVFAQSLAQCPNQ